MAIYNLQATGEVPDAAETLAILADAIGGSENSGAHFRAHAFAPARRVLAASDRRSPDEGLALLTAYVEIDDIKIRQAILDAVLAIAARRVRA